MVRLLQRRLRLKASLRGQKQLLDRTKVSRINIYQTRESVIVVVFTWSAMDPSRFPYPLIPNSTTGNSSEIMCGDLMQSLGFWSTELSVKTAPHGLTVPRSRKRAISRDILHSTHRRDVGSILNLNEILAWVRMQLPGSKRK